jgi:hypothetical protein
MPIMRHGKTTIKIFDLDLNLRHNSRKSHVVVTTIIITTLVIIMIRDYGKWNRLIGGMMFDKLFTKFDTMRR